MSDNYSIDDILAEIDRKRGGGSKSTESVTEIISETELHSAMNSTSHTRMPSAEESEPVSGDEEARERAESIRRAAEANRRKAENKRREREERQQEQRRLEQERAEQEQRMQFSEPEKPAEPEHSGYTSELSSPTEAAKLFGEPEEPPKPERVVQPESEYVQPYVKPKVSGGDDDIVFHTKSDLVTSETMQMKKLQRINEINRALLEADRAAEEPEELLDSLNPMESREKAVDGLKNSAEPQGDIGDTLAVSGNDLKKMSSGETEHVKEYSPVTSRRKGSKADEVLFTPGAQKKSDAAGEKDRSSEALVASLNKKLREQREKDRAEERTVTITDLSDPRNLPPRALNIDYDKKVIDTSILPKTDPVAAVREAEALAERKKRKIANFMLADIDDEVEDAEEKEAEDDDYDDEDDEDEIIDLDDENVITERLARAGKGLAGRLTILALLTAAAAIAAVFYFFKIDSIPILSVPTRRSTAR